MPQEPEKTGSSGVPSDSPSMGESTEKKELPSFDKFESELTPDLKLIHELLRPSFLFRAFELAKQKQKMEDKAEHLERQAPQIRASIAEHKKVATQIRKAIKAIKLAQQVAKEEDPELLKNLDVLAAQELLVEAEADLLWVINEILPGSIHPHLRKKGERPTHFNPPTSSSKDFPGFGVAQIGSLVYRRA